MLLVSCGVSKPIQSTSVDVNETSVIEIHKKDSVFETKEDSSTFSAELRIDSTGQVSLGNAKTTAGDHLEEPKVSIEGNKITVDCHARAQKLFYEWKETFIKNQKTKTITNTITVEVEKELTNLQHTMIGMGWVLSACILIFVLGLVIKKFIKPF